MLTDVTERLVLQPISKEPFTDVTSSALRDMGYQGIVAKFPLDGLCELRGLKLDQDFLIVVVGQGTERKSLG